MMKLGPPDDLMGKLCDNYQCLMLVFSVIYLDYGDISGGGPRPGRPI